MIATVEVGKHDATRKLFITLACQTIWIHFFWLEIFFGEKNREYSIYLFWICAHLVCISFESPMFILYMIADCLVIHLLLRYHNDFSLIFHNLSWQLVRENIASHAFWNTLKMEESDLLFNRFWFAVTCAKRVWRVCLTNWSDSIKMILNFSVFHFFISLFTQLYIPNSV